MPSKCSKKVWEFPNISLKIELHITIGFMIDCLKHIFQWVRHNNFKWMSTLTDITTANYYIHCGCFPKCDIYTVSILRRAGAVTCAYPCILWHFSKPRRIPTIINSGYGFESTNSCVSHYDYISTINTLFSFLSYPFVNSKWIQDASVVEFRSWNGEIGRIENQ